MQNLPKDTSVNSLARRTEKIERGPRDQGSSLANHLPISKSPRKPITFQMILQHAKTLQSPHLIPHIGRPLPFPPLGRRSLRTRGLKSPSCSAGRLCKEDRKKNQRRLEISLLSSESRHPPRALKMPRRPSPRIPDSNSGHPPSPRCPQGSHLSFQQMSSGQSLSAPMRTKSRTGSLQKFPRSTPMETSL